MSSDFQNEPFFIIGSGRSGTTMLRLMLNDHPRIRVPRETDFLPTLMDRLPHIFNAASHWCNQVTAAVESGKKLGSDLYLEIRYEELVLKTEDTLKRVCTFIGEEYDSRMLSFYKNGAIKETDFDKPHHNQHHTKTRRPPDPSDTYRWRREMSWIEVALFEAYAGKTMDRVGQTRRFRGLLRLIPSSLRIFDNLNQKFRRIFTPTNQDREFLTLPDYAYFLYYLLRPIRLLGKYTLIAWKNLLPN